MPSLDLGTLRVLQVTGHVAHEVLAVNVAENLLPKRTGLLEVDCSRTKISIRKKRGGEWLHTLSNLTEVRLSSAEEYFVLDALVHLRLV